MTRALAGAVVGLLAAGVTVTVVHAGSLRAVAALIVVAGSLWCACTRRPPVALALLMLYLGTLDGYLKLATGSTYVTFARDVLLYALTIGLLVRAAVARRSLPMPPLAVWVIAFFTLVLIQLLNPNNGSLTHSVAGVRQNLEFVPLFFLVFAFVRSKRALRGFVILLTFLAVLNGVVNVIQFSETPQQLASWGPGYAERVLGTKQFSSSGRTFYAGAGQQYTRPFGLMSDAGTGGLVCAFALGGIVALASLPGRRRYLPLAVAAAIIAVAGVLTSQGRSVVVGSVLIVMAYGAMTASARARGRLASLLAVAALAGVASVAATQILGSAPSRYGGLSSAKIVQTTAAARGNAFKAIPSNLVRYPLGSGLGSGGPAAGQSGAPADAATLNAENEISFAALDTGVPGMLVLIAFTAVVCAIGVRRCPREPDPETRMLLAAILSPLAALLVLYWVSPLTPTTPTGPYLWAAGGIVSYWLMVRPAELQRAEPARPTTTRYGALTAAP